MYYGKITLKMEVKILKILDFKKRLWDLLKEYKDNKTANTIDWDSV